MDEGDERTERQSDRRDLSAGDQPTWRETALVGALVAVLLTLWAVITPVYQMPDEVQHAMRATSVLIEPWIASGDHFIVDQLHTNPIARDPGPQLGWLFYHADHYLTREDIPRLKGRVWGEQPLTPWPVREYWAGACYPTLYHLAVFALAQPATAIFGLTPYQSTFAYRLASVLLASLAWALAFRGLARAFGVESARRGVFFLLSIPMVVFPSAGTAPDAIVFPLATLAIVECWRVSQTGQRWPGAAGLLLLVALIKPSGLVIAAAVVVAAAVAWVAGGAPARRAALAGGAAIVALALSEALFYLWSPPRFLGSGPVHLSFVEWLRTAVGRLPGLWKMFWGWLGWLDYTLPPIWYKGLTALVALNAVIAGRALLRDRRPIFLPLVLAVYSVLVIGGEYVYLSRTGFNLRGQHFLPAAAGLLPLVLHDHVVTRRLLMGYLAVMQLAFIRETILRYYNGDLGTLLAAMPF
jgi:hypothetical protein